MITISDRLKLYKRPDIQREIIREAKGKEVAIKFSDKGFGKRPDVLINEADILELAKQGATSFHISEETWKNPLSLRTEMKKREQEALRKGWDLVLDIDCKFIEYSKIACDLLIKTLKYHDIKSVSVKFSGNKGFHIGVPFEAFPKTVNGEPIESLFPETPRRIAAYLTDFIKDMLGEKIQEFEGNDFTSIVKKVGLEAEKITRYEKDKWGTRIAKLDVEPFLEVDTILISSRHLYRSTYSFNEKSGLVSIPLDPDKVLDFTKDMAKPINVKVHTSFMNRSKANENECSRLFREAYDHKPKVEEIIEKEKRFDFEEIKEAVPEELFPPCIKLILKGLKDGRKRSMFALVNFLNSVGWNYEQIEEKLAEWNKNNEEPLREVNIKGQVRYHKQNKTKKLPPNCSHKAYYKDIGVCKPDNICAKIKNPVNYSRRRVFGLNRSKNQNLYKPYMVSSRSI